jgi:hypothetical protein
MNISFPRLRKPYDYLWREFRLEDLAMASTAEDDIAHRAEQIYERELRSQLEPTHRGEFLAIEPLSGDHYLGRTYNEAIQASRRAHPDRLCYCLRIGHPVAVELGNSPS